jgi:hypothetical membrane protein
MSSPLVNRSVRSGGVLFALAAAQFVVVMAVVQQHYAGYSLSQNYISDLGGAHSPWALLFDGSVILLGLLTILASLLAWNAFDERPSRGIGLFFLMVAGVGAIGVGAFPETTPVLSGGAHVIASDVAFLGAGLAFLVLSFAMRAPPHWRYSSTYTLFSGLLVLVAIGLFVSGHYVGLGPGGMERLIVAPVLLWGLVEGVHLSALPRFAPGVVRKATT